MDEYRGRMAAGGEAHLGAAADEAKEAARAAADAGKERARSFFDEQKGTAAKRLQGVASALRDTARSLEAEDETRPTSPLVERAADAVDRVARSLRERDLDGFVADAEDFARRSPGVFLGGALASGFLLARFLKSSSERRHETPWPMSAGGDARPRSNEPFGSVSAPTGTPASTAAPRHAPGWAPTSTPRRGV